MVTAYLDFSRMKSQPGMEQEVLVGDVVQGGRFFRVRVTS